MGLSDIIKKLKKDILEKTEVIELKYEVLPGSNEFVNELRSEGHAYQQNIKPVKYSTSDSNIIELTNEIPRNSLDFYFEARKEGFAQQPGLLQKFYEKNNINVDKYETINKEYIIKGALANEQLRKELSEKREQERLHQEKERIFQEKADVIYKKVYNSWRRLFHTPDEKERAMELIYRFMDSSDDRIINGRSRFDGHQNFWKQPESLIFSYKRFIKVRNKLFGDIELDYKYA